MKRILWVIACVAVTSSWTTAKTPPTVRPVLRPVTDDAPAGRVQTTAQVFRPVTQSGATRPTTQPVKHAQTTVEVTRPQTTVQVNRPATQEINHPVTTVEVIHPQTTVEVVRPQTISLAEGAPVSGNAQQGGKNRAVAQTAATSMSDYKPKPAKDFTAAKAAPMGGSSMNLGNSNANQAAKDAAAKASLLGSQNNQTMNVDPKQNKLGGVDKLVTDRAKWKGKKK